MIQVKPTHLKFARFPLLVSPQDHQTYAHVDEAARVLAQQLDNLSQPIAMRLGVRVDQDHVVTLPK